MKRKQFLAVLLALCMALGTLPITAFASGETPSDAIAEIAEDETETQEENEPTADETETQEENEPTADETETQEDKEPSDDETETQEDKEPPDETNEDDITDAETDEEPTDIMTPTLRNASPVALSSLQSAINGTGGTSTNHFGYAGTGIEAWNEGNTRNIKLNADVEGYDWCNVLGVKTVVLDLNGHTIYGTKNYVLGIARGSTLTVKDTSENPGSVIGNNMAINDQGTFHLENGTVCAKSYAISLTATGSLTTSGEIYSDFVGIYTNGSVTVNGGTVKSNQYGVYVPKGGSAVVNGGTVDAGTYGIYATNSSVTLTDGTVLSKDCGIYAWNGSVAITGGTVDADHDGVYVYNNATFSMSDVEIIGNENGVAIYRGGTHTISGGTISGLFAVTLWGYQELDENKELTGNEPYGKTELTVNGGKIIGIYHGISGNARRDNGYSRGGTIINIEEGAYIESEESVGIYHPQTGDLNINGGTIIGVSGVEVRGGNLEMTGGTVCGNTESLSSEPSGDGPTVTGAGIAVSQHVERQAIKIDISGGTITGYTSFYEDAFQGNSEADLAKVQLKITGGMFVSMGESSAFSRHKKEFITAGMYSQPVGMYTSNEEGIFDHLGSLTEEEMKNVQSTLQNPTGKVHCIKVENSELPYHVGYLTGIGHSLTLNVGESSTLVPEYSLNGDLVKGKDGENGQIVNAAFVNVDDVNHKTEYKENSVIKKWTSGNEAVATVDESGIVTALHGNPSPVEITATLLNDETVTFSVTVPYTVKFDLNGGTGDSFDPITEIYGRTITLPSAKPTRGGYKFQGWKEETTGTIYQPGDEITVIGDMTLVAQWKKKPSPSTSDGDNDKPDKPDKPDEPNKPADVPQLNKEDHFAYVSGYPEGNFRPERNMTRAEVAVMFSNLLLEDTQESTSYGNTFTDVAPSEWYYNRVGFMEQFGIISGYPDGSFRPNAPITRAEFATIAAKFDELKETGNATFVDLPDDHWGKKFIEMAYNHGWISGYPDGTVKPDKYITRAEVVSVTNRMLERVCDQAYIESHKASIKDYFDITNAHWAYYHIMEASNGHLYVKGEQSENWISLNP